MTIFRPARATSGLFFHSLFFLLQTPVTGAAKRILVAPPPKTPAWLGLLSEQTSSNAQEPSIVAIFRLGRAIFRRRWYVDTRHGSGCMSWHIVGGVPGGCRGILAAIVPGQGPHMCVAAEGLRNV